MKRILLIVMAGVLSLTATAQPARPYRTRAFKAIGEVQLPTAVDNSKLKYFPAVFSQKGGSCAQSSAIRYVFTYEMNRLLDRDANASQENIYSYFFTWNFLNDGKDQGGFAENAFQVAQNHGVMSLADFPDPVSPYEFRWVSGYDAYIRSMHNRLEEVYVFPSTDRQGLEQIKRYLYDAGNGSPHGGVVSFSAYVTGLPQQVYEGPSTTGYNSIITGYGYDGAHAMTIVGYDDQVEFVKDGKTHKGAFIIVNSWGTWWGDMGKCYIPYYLFEQQRNVNVLDHDMVGCHCKVHEPTLIFKVKVDYTSRDDLRFVLGAADHAWAISPEYTLQTSIASEQGGDHPMQGSGKSSELEIAFDFSSIAERIQHYKEPKYYLDIIRSERGNVTGTGTIQYFSVLDCRTGKEYVCDRLKTPVTLGLGLNRFELPTTQLITTSGSPVGLHDGEEGGKTRPFILRTADGRYVKMQVMSEDKESGKMTIRYFFQNDGSRNLQNDLN